MTVEERFLQELNVFRSEIEAVIRYAYSEGAIHETARKSKRVLDTLNKNPSFWNSVLGSLTVSTFVALGRIFDVKNASGEKHTIHTLFKIVLENRQIFSKESFAERWDSTHSGMLEYKETYMKDVCDMKDSDWKELKKLKSALCKQYQDLYRPIRDVFGHRILIDNEKISLLMSKASVREMEKFCTKLKNLHEGLWQLYHNGRGPVTPLRTGKYSSRGFVYAKYEPYKSISLAKQYTLDAKGAMELLKKGNYSKR